MTDQERPWWVISVVVCIAFLTLIAIIWYQKITSYSPNPGQLINDIDVQNFLNSDKERVDTHERLFYIPTGVFLQSVGFLSATDVNITGYIWQKYDNTIPDMVSRGFVLPEQVNSNNTVIKEAYRRKEADYTVIGWYFDVTLRQPFNYSQYPLDTQDVWIRLWHKDFDRNIILVPDLSSYDSTQAGDTFGLDDELVSGGWKIDETYFEYRDGHYDTNFGISNYVGKEHFPELYFTIVVSRNFLNSFVVNLVPMIIVSALLFYVLMITTRNEAKSAIFGFNTSGAIGSSSALFFVVMLAHIQLRQQFSGAGIVYLEWFYLVLYAYIFMVCFNVYLFSLGSNKGLMKVVYFGDNIIPKLTYWPILLASLVVVSYFHFY